jgi:serine/threonine-protein kinase HipA
LNGPSFSLITRHDRVDLSPAYDLLNSTIAIGNAQEELALPIRGKKANLTRNDLLSYFAAERLQINTRVLTEVIERFRGAFKRWETLIAASFLSTRGKKQYADILAERIARLQL